MKNVLKSIDAWRHRKSREFKRRRRLSEAEALAAHFGEGFSVICNNCFGGRLYQDLGLPYATPTAGLFMVISDFIEFCSHIEHYLFHSTMTFTDRSKWEQLNGWRADGGLAYPIGVLDGKVELHFLHYPNEAEARQKWERRAARVNIDNLVIVGVQIHMVSDADYPAFEKIPHVHKYFFTTARHQDCPSEIVLPADGPATVGDGMRHTRRFYRAWLRHI